VRRFRLLFLIVAVGLLAPLAVLVYRAQRSAALERRMRHQAVAERVFDEMERALSDVLERAEEQPFDRFATGGEWPFAVGYFQIDPDGSVHALRPADGSNEPSQRERDEIERTVSAYWHEAGAASDLEGAAPSAPGEEWGGATVAGALRAPAQGPGTTVAVGAKGRPQPEARDTGAAQEQVSAFDALRSLNKAAGERQRKMEYGAARSPGHLFVAPPSPDAAAVEGSALPDDGLRSEAELAPLVGRVIDDRHLMLFRTVVIDTRGYRQGVLIETARLADWLRVEGLGSDGIGEYATVSFSTPYGATTPAAPADGAFVYQHRFAEPFDDLRARLALRPLPGADNLTYVLALGGLLLASGALGLAALYRMVSVVVSYAERRSNFVAAVSHELKTPLTAIRMYGEMLRDGLVASEAKRDEYYRHITTESERLSRLINNVLEFARLEKGTRAMVLTTGSLAPAVRDLAALVRPHVEGQGLALDVEVDDALPPVRFEPDALMQVLWNLLDNAVKYARDAEPKRVALRCWSDDGGVHVAVRDHGPGVAPRHLGRIFEPFYRGESELTRRSQGTGLGLALVRGLVERMDARVSGRNVTDGGFEVDIVFRPVA
jgi:signal transduction histidine kinase